MTLKTTASIVAFASLFAFACSSTTTTTTSDSGTKTDTGTGGGDTGGGGGDTGGGGGDTGGGGGDTGGTMTCEECTASKCDAESKACQMEPAFTGCKALIDCLNACTTADCQNKCISDSMSTEGKALIQCVITNCADSCTAE